MAPGIVSMMSTPGPVVGLIIDPSPSNRHPSLFPPGPTGHKVAGNTN